MLLLLLAEVALPVCSLLLVLQDYGFMVRACFTDCTLASLALMLPVDHVKVLQAEVTVGILATHSLLVRDALE